MFLFNAPTKRVRVGVIVADFIKSVNSVMIGQLKVNWLELIRPLTFYMGAFDGAEQVTLDVGELLPRVNERVAIGAFETILMIGTIFRLHNVLAIVNGH